VLRSFLIWLILSLTVAPLVLAMAVGELAALIWMSITLIDEFGLLPGLSLAGIGFITTYVLAVTSHEVGHALGGRLVGWPVHCAHVGPLILARRNGSWQFGWDRRLGWLGGRVISTPDPEGRWRTAVFVVAGPAVNLALAAASALFVVSGALSLLRCWVGFFAVHSLFLGLLSLLPLAERRPDSDGLFLWRLFIAGRAWRSTPNQPPQ
jgi:hypothetical protein